MSNLSRFNLFWITGEQILRYVIVKHNYFSSRVNIFTVYKMKIKGLKYLIGFDLLSQQNKKNKKNSGTRDRTNFMFNQTPVF